LKKIGGLAFNILRFLAIARKDVNLGQKEKSPTTPVMPSEARNLSIVHYALSIVHKKKGRPATTFHLQNYRTETPTIS
jgi:hypothetical protein